MFLQTLNWLILDKQLRENETLVVNYRLPLF